MSPALAFLSPVPCSDLVILTKLSHRHCTFPVAETERWPSPSPPGPFIGSPSHQMAPASTQLWKLDAQAPSWTPPSPSTYIQSHLTLSLFSLYLHYHLPSKDTIRSWLDHHNGLLTHLPTLLSDILPHPFSPLHSCWGIFPKGLSDQIWTWS